VYSARSSKPPWGAPVAVKLALPKLLDDVVERFALEGPWVVTPAPAAEPPVVGVPVPNLFGWRSKAKQLVTGTRIVWIPGDDASGNVGKLAPARHPGRNPRPLHTLHELCTVYIVANDATAAEDERKQYEATRLLYDAWLRAVYRAAHGTYEIVSSSWVTDKLERRFGATLRVLISVEAMVPDAVQTAAPVDTHAEITTGIDSNGDATFTEEVFSTEEPEGEPEA
jgi:hypothetical protein